MTKSRGIRAPKGTRAKWAEEHQGRHICECGCGQLIDVKPVHFNIGVPRFLHGHNPVITHTKPKVDRTPCECGCGALANYGKRFISGHNGRGKPRPEHVKNRLRETKLGELNPMYGKRPANAKEPPVATPCECGCGGLATASRRFIIGHNMTGTRMSNWRGWFQTPAGYIMQEAPDHPYAVKGYIFQHRLVVERHLRETQPDSSHLERIGGQLYLRRDIEVHHEDDIKDNNAIENLTPLTKTEHAQLHWARGKKHR